MLTALSTRDIDPITVTAAISADFSLAAATVGVVEVGSGASSNALSVLNEGGTLDSSDQATGANLTTRRSAAASMGFPRRKSSTAAWPGGVGHHQGDGRNGRRQHCRRAVDWL